MKECERKSAGSKITFAYTYVAQPLFLFPLTAPSRSSQCLVVKIQDAMCVYDNLGITILRDSKPSPSSPRHSQLCVVDAFSATEITFAPLRYQLLFHDKNRCKACHTVFIVRAITVRSASLPPAGGCLRGAVLWRKHPLVSAACRHRRYS